MKHTCKCFSRCTLAAAILISVLFPALAGAQTSSVWFAKFVCGYQTGNVPLLNNPNPPIDNTTYEELKPGNYATVVNIVNTSLNQETVFVNAMVTTGDPVTTSLNFPVAAQPVLGLLPAPGIGSNMRVGCPAVVAAMIANGAPPPTPGGIVEGHFVIFAGSGGANLQVDAVYTFESQNAFERHVLWGSDELGLTGIVRDLQTLTLAGILAPFDPKTFAEGLKDIAASGAGGLGLGASIDVERCDPVDVDLSGLAGGAQELAEKMRHVP